jgi:integrase
MFEAAQLRNIIDNADQPLKAMILLSINCGFGNADCGKLTLSAVDFKTGWIDFPRSKMAVERRCPLSNISCVRTWARYQLCPPYS